MYSIDRIPFSLSIIRWYLQGLGRTYLILIWGGHPRSDLEIPKSQMVSWTNPHISLNNSPICLMSKPSSHSLCLKNVLLLTLFSPIFSSHLRIASSFSSFQSPVNYPNLRKSPSIRSNLVASNGYWILSPFFLFSLFPLDYLVLEIDYFFISFITHGDKGNQDFCMFLRALSLRFQTLL